MTGKQHPLYFYIYSNFMWPRVPRKGFCSMEKMSKEIMDKFRNIFSDQDEIYPWVIGAEVLAGIMKNEDQLEEGNTVTAADIFESLRFEQESASNFGSKPSKKDDKPKKSTKPVYKIYEDLAYISAMEATRCHILIDKLKAIIDLLNAQQQYYEAMSVIERDNDMFGFDLSI